MARLRLAPMFTRTTARTSHDDDDDDDDRATPSSSSSSIASAPRRSPLLPPPSPSSSSSSSTSSSSGGGGRATTPIPDNTLRSRPHPGHGLIWWGTPSARSMYPRMRAEDMASTSGWTRRRARPPPPSRQSRRREAYPRCHCSRSSIMINCDDNSINGYLCSLSLLCFFSPSSIRRAMR